MHINSGQQNVSCVVLQKRWCAKMVAELVRSMKAGMRRLAAGVSVISAVDQQGARYAMTASSVTSVSDDPPSLLVCINQNARICPVLTKGQTFGINLLGQSHADVSIVCSTGDQGDKRFDVGHWATTALGTPIIADAEAVFECCVDEVYAYGTHHIVVAKITSVIISSGDADPLIYCDGGYRRLAK